jgi:hypothetical protein
MANLDRDKLYIWVVTRKRRLIRAQVLQQVREQQTTATPETRNSAIPANLSCTYRLW